MSDRLGVSPSTIFALFLLSGATSLVYEVLWLRQLILIFGSTQFATSTILSTFMGGLAVGAFAAGRWITRHPAVRPLRAYGLLEIGIGLYALVVPALFRGLSPIYQLVWDAGASESFLLLSLAKFVGIAAVLLPPTVLMGATLPLLAREIADDPQRIGGKVGGLYAINTVGAVSGVFVAGFVAMPNLGLSRTLLGTALVNVALGSGAILLARARGLPVRIEARPGASAAAAARPAAVRATLWAFGLSGFGALVLEVAWTRVLALIVGSSVYAFSLMLLAFLIGLAAGSACFSSFLRRRPATDAARLLALLLVSAGVLAFATTHLFQLLPRLFGAVFFAWDPGPNGWFAVQLLLGLMVMFPATFALGGVFPAVLQIHARSLDEVSRSVGLVYASNTAGTIVGASVAGFVLLPLLGVQSTVIGVALLELFLGLLMALVWLARSPSRRWTLIGGGLLAAAVMVAGQPAWDVRMMNSGVYMNLFGRDDGWEGFRGTVYENNEVVFAAEGLTSSIFVADQPEFDNRYLSVNGKIDASTNADMETQLLAAHLPLLLHDGPSDVLVIGLASGITVGAVATHDVERIRVVEIEKMMVPAARLFEAHNNHVLDDPRVAISINDARNELEFSSETYDVIVSEPSNPWMTVASNLFTRDFFRMAGKRLREDGVFCQWIQNYYLPAEDMRSILSAFHDSFPYVMLFETFDGVDLLVLGSRHPLLFDLEEVGERMSDLSVRMDLGRANVRAPEDFLTLFRLGPEQVDRLVAGAPVNTDDNARVEFSAPKTLGLYTLDENLALIHRYLADPFDHVRPAIEDQPTLDRMRVELAERQLRRGYFDVAADSARRVSDGALRERADRITDAAARALAKQ